MDKHRTTAVLLVSVTLVLLGAGKACERQGPQPIAAATAPRQPPLRRAEPPTEPNSGLAGYAMAGAIAAVGAIAATWVSRRRRRP